MKQFSKVPADAPAQPEAWVLSIYEEIREKGKLEDKLEGKIEVALNAYDNGLSVPLIANITGLEEAQVLDVLKAHGRA